MRHALNQLLKIANLEAVETLISIYNDLPNGHRRAMIVDTIEVLSSRLSFKVIDINGNLQFVTK
ncbi:MAG: hypothetical protein ACI9D5_000098 [Candidatus Endobugula sp.]|jgi:hypothetical protein